MLAGEGEQMIHGTVDVSEMMGSAVHLHPQACGRDTIIIVQTMSMQGATNSSFGIRSAHRLYLRRQCSASLRSRNRKESGILI